MKGNLKKMLCAALSAAMAAGMVVLPTTASAADYTPIFEGDTVLKEWKFDFGAADSTAEDGYTLVTPDTNFTANTGGEYQYGFLGTDAEDYNLTNRYDGWTTQKGQTIELAAGGGNGLNDAVGVIGAGGTGENEGKDVFGNQADKYYPTRFALKVEDDTYYRIRATVTTLDPTKDATVSLYTERKHPIYTERTISAGEADTIEFSVRVTPIYYEKSAPTGTIADEMVTVGVLGENSALAAVEIQQVESYPTVWVLGDSTVTDGNTTLPFFTLQNYTGVGTGLTKYLPRDMAMINEGEGGLNAADNYHFNMVKNRIKSGDYMYVEYGHNHKSDGPSGYKSHLDKYYNACHEVGAKLIIVSPVQSVNSWNTNTNKWDDRFGGENNFEGAGRSYVEEKVAGGATDVAFVNLTKTSVEFVDKVTADNGNVKTAAQFYYQTSKGGGTDSSHPNDAGAENFAYCFFEAAKEVTDETQAAVLKPILDNMTDEMPNLVSQEVIDGGIGGTAWPQYIVPTSEKYPVLINDVVFNEDGTVKQVDVTTRAAEISMAGTYGVVIITIYNPDGTEKGKIYAVDQVDNSTGYGSQTIVNFRGDVTLEEGDTFSAIVVEADADTNPVEGGKIYSAVYKITEIEEQLLVNERNEEKYENFDYYGAEYEGKESLEMYNGWTKRGSSGMTLTLGKSGDIKYATIQSDGKKNGVANQGSTYVAKDLVKEIGSSGRYMVSMDMKYESGNGMNVKLVTGNSDKEPWGSDTITLFSVDSEGKLTLEGKNAGQISAIKFSNIKYIIDMDLGTASLSIDGGDEITADLADYSGIDVAPKHPKFTGFMFEGNKVAFNVKVSNLQVAKMKQKVLPKYTLTAAASNTEGGTVKAFAGAPTGFELEYADGNAVITAEKSDDKATLIEVKSKADGILESIKTTPVTFTDALTKTIAVTEGSKLMLWDSIDGLKPLAPSITAADIPAETEVTASLNTIVTAKAEVKNGYVFMGWSDGTNIVSTDAEYIFRLREDVTLTAQFVKEPGVEDITNYSLDADSTFISAAAGTKTTMKIVNPVDASGTPMNKVTNSDVVWSSSDADVTVDENGIVTVGERFTTGDDITKSVTVTGILNGITKTCVITLHTYTYTEDFSKLTGAWGFDADAVVGDGILTLLGKSGANKTTEINKTLETDIAAAKKVTIKLDWKSLVAAGNGRHSNFVLMDSDNKPVFALRGQGKTGLFYSADLASGTDSDDKFTKFANFSQNWYTLDLTIDFETGKINGTVSETASGTAVATITDANVPNGAANLAKLYAVNTYSAAPMAIDNVCIKVY